MKKNLMIGTVSLMVLALLGWVLIPTPAEIEIVTVTQGQFEHTVQEDGKTRVQDRHVVSTPLTERVTRILLKQGDSVAMDAEVATLWPVVPAPLDERARAEQLARVGATQAVVSKAQANRERATAAIDQAGTELKRSETLAHQGFVSPKQNETGRLNVSPARERTGKCSPQRVRRTL